MPQTRPNIDVEGGDLLKQLGDDASKWAAAFCDTAKRKGLEIDEEWMIGWFANAIEHSGDVRRRRAPPPDAPGSPQLDEPLRSRERAALDIAVKALRDTVNAATAYRTARVAFAINRIAALVPDAVKWP